MNVYILYLFEKIFFIHIAAKLLTNSISPIFFKSVPVFRRRPINEAYSFAINFLFSVVIMLYVCLYIIFI